MTSIIDRLRDALISKRGRGGRLHLDTLDIRSALFAVRLTLQVQRFDISTGIEQSQRALNLVPRDAKARRERISAELKRLRERRHSDIPRLKTLTDRLIETLERIDKRASRRFAAIRSKQELGALSREWRAHVRWIRFNLAYFKPFRLPPDFRIMQRRRIDKLVYMAKQEIERRALNMPNEKELRIIARAFVRSCKQGHHGSCDFLYMVCNTEDPIAQSRLFEFFAPRIGGSGERTGSRKKEPKWSRKIGT